MAIYAIGDLQGCLDPLKKLLEDCRFDPTVDRCWFVGDLVNRGPQSLDTLRFIRSLGSAALTVLGNHDLYLMSVAAGVLKSEPDAALRAVLDAPDSAELFDWLRHCSLMHATDQFVAVHAGLLPQWSVAEARTLATEVEAMLRGGQWSEFLQHLFGNRPDVWNSQLEGWDRYRIVINAMTRMRFLDADGRLNLKAKGAPEDAPAGSIPWYAVPNAAWRTHTVVCGHWSAMGYRDLGHVIALDSGCVWGGCLTAVRLEDRQAFQVKCPQYVVPTGAD